MKKFFEHKKLIKEYVNKLKSEPCMDCKKKYPYYVMQYDHRVPKRKLYNISEIVNRGMSWGVLKKELKKCDLVCGNCHAIREHKRKRADL